MSLAYLSTPDLERRVRALSDYQLSIFASGEDSEARDRAETNVVTALSLLNAELRSRRVA